MATTLNAVLSIAAKVTGEGAVNAITGAVKKLENTSKNATGVLRGLAGSAGGLGNALGMLAPALSVGGLVGLATNSIKGADAMNDLSQKTGVSVEALARFKKAAAVSGTDLEGVSKALVKLSKGMVDAANTGKGPAAEAFKTLGISATDASGKLKSSERVMLEVANRFKTMPDGAEKTAIALQLFGKAGADMIPMLNMGGEAIEKMSTKMTAAFAKKADEYSDKLAILQGKIGGVGTSIAIALLPALDALANILTTVVDVFTKLPEPLQAIIGGFALLAIGLAALAPALLLLAPAFTAIGAAIAAISAGALAATIAGWLGALVPFIATLGTMAAGLGTVVSVLVGWPLVIGAALVAIGVLLYSFRDQIGAFLGWIVKGAIDLVSKIGQALSGVAGFVNKIISGIVQFTVEYYKSLYALFVFYIIAPIKLAWDGLVTFLSERIGQFVSGVGAVWSGIVAAFTSNVITPIINAWNAAFAYLGNALAPVVSAITKAWTAISTSFTTYVSGPITRAWSSMVTFLGTALSNVAGGITRVWTGIVNGVKGALRGMVQFAANALNGVIGAIRAVIQGINKARAATNMAPIGMPGFITVPAFAEGGVVNRPTLAMVGEAGPEYIIPASKMAAASTNYLAGSRGASVLNGGGGASTTGTPQINIRTGPVMQTADGQQWVSIGDLERAQRQTVEAMMAQLRTPAGRYAMGVR